jgi:hypothetical protein
MQRITNDFTLSFSFIFRAQHGSKTDITLDTFQVSTINLFFVFMH